jgi:hypothetical protein
MCAALCTLCSRRTHTDVCARACACLGVHVYALEHRVQSAAHINLLHVCVQIHTKYLVLSKTHAHMHVCMSIEHKNLHKSRVHAYRCVWSVCAYLGVHVYVYTR